jgi:hypothetical protein
MSTSFSHILILSASFSYAFLVNSHGPAINDQAFLFGLPNVTSSNVVIRNNQINNIRCWTNEVPAAVVDGIVQTDARGSVFQFVRPYDGHPMSMYKNGTYKGNVVADMQIMVAKAIMDGIIVDAPLHQMKANKINHTLIEWASSGKIKYKPQLRCGGDSMHHVAKGTIIFRIENTRGAIIQGNSINNVANLSPAPYTTCVDLHAALTPEGAGELMIGNVRGISFSAVHGFDDGRPSSIQGNRVVNLKSNNAQVVVGIDVQGYSDRVLVQDNFVNLGSSVNRSETDKYYALRLRSYAQNVTIDNNNVFMQDILKLNARSLRHAHRMLASGADMGGCPFARLFGFA